MLAAPILVAFNAPPATTLVNQLLAAAGWGTVCMLKGAAPMQTLRARPATVLLIALAGLCAAVVWSWHQSLPFGLAVQALGSLLMAAGLVALASQPGAAAAPRVQSDGHTFAGAMLVVASLSAVLACVQVFAPEWVDGTFIAALNPDYAGRAVGNLRQPNHLSSVLLWGLVAWVPMAHTKRWFGRRVSWLAAAPIGALLILALVLTASRTGALGLFVLAIWGAADRRLDGKVRIGLLASPLMYLACWCLVAWWARWTGYFFWGEVRMGEGGAQALATSRYELWHNALTLIQSHPWRGTGFGEFGMAWMLTPFSDRSGELFDHAHNLPLHLAVELGLPGALLLMSLLGWAIWQAAKRTWRTAGDEGVAARAVFMMLLVIGLHSLLEYPLWYNYFLFPTAWAWGLCLRQPINTAVSPTEQAHPKVGVVASGLVMVAGSLWLQWDYRSVAAIYQPSDSTLTQAQRISRGQSSVVFSYFADYAAALKAEPPAPAMALFSNAAPVMLDPPLMKAWANALDAAGQTDKAHYLAERLREFPDSESQAFFSQCSNSAVATKPFQCEPSSQPHTWKEFLR
ncbi:hypothetical protein GCM10009107_06950 [Ideonella azotifigens]|uniref:Polymerase n=1 Tax=Ideonella azotifigens TaxID=513160 RepID=A0ABP3V010_9BURK